MDTEPNTPIEISVCQRGQWLAIWTLQGVQLSPCLMGVEEWWTYIPWSELINGGGKTDNGRRMGRKLSALELGGLLALI